MVASNNMSFTSLFVTLLLEAAKHHQVVSKIRDDVSDSRSAQPYQQVKLDSCDQGKDCHPPKQILLDRVKLIKKHDLPQWKKGGAMQAYFGFYAESLSSVKTSEMSFDLDIYSKTSWTDERLKHEFSRPFVITTLEEIALFWKPDLYFANAKSAEYQTVTEPNMSLRIFKDGSIHLSARVTLTASCNQNLKKYPMDTQNCALRVLSYSHTVEKLNISWFSHQPIGWNPQIELPEMSLVSMQGEYCNGTYRYGETQSHYMIGQFSCLQASILLQRQIGYHVVQTYIPTGLIVVISWVSFWIDPNAIPARISLSFTTLLTLSTMAAGVRVSLPPVSYAKAIDIWMGMCMLFVFFGLLQFAFVNSNIRKASKLEEALYKTMDEDCTYTGPSVQRSYKRRSGSSQSSNLLASDRSVITKRMTISKARPILRKSSVESIQSDSTRDVRYQIIKLTKAARNIDRVCAVMFPSAFVIFNLFYWIFYIYA